MVSSTVSTRNWPFTGASFPGARDEATLIADSCRCSFPPSSCQRRARQILRPAPRAAPPAACRLRSSATTRSNQASASRRAGPSRRCGCGEPSCPCRRPRPAPRNDPPAARLRDADQAPVGVEIGRDRDIGLLGAAEPRVLLDQARDVPASSALAASTCVERRDARAHRRASISPRSASSTPRRRPANSRACASINATAGAAAAISS